ncbi:MAG: hypothetical protein HZA78_04660 [Candidatus Schekmanbacteria bacterium]|nr:hypothetical protein [Candidatus Schekmanbacteria bacterium]
MLTWLEFEEVDYMHHRANFKIGRQWTFSTERKFMRTLGLSPTRRTHVLHIKGAPEIMSARCRTILVAQGIEPNCNSKFKIVKCAAFSIKLI